MTIHLIKNITISLILLVMLSGGVIIAQWQPDQRLTNDTANSWISSNSAWSVAASGNTVHTVWKDYRTGNDQIFYKRSTDGGVTWGADTRLTNNASSPWYTSVTVSGSVVLVLWQDYRDGNYEIYGKRSTDGGLSWGADVRLTNNTAESWDPSAVISGQSVFVVWQDNRDGNYEIYFLCSTDAGASWGANTRLTNDVADSYYPSIAASGPDIHVVWEDNRNGNYEIYYKNSSDAGVSWGADTRLTNNSAESLDPCIALSGTVVSIVWDDYRDGNYEIYFKRSSDGGISWGTDTRLTSNSAESRFPSIAASGTNLHLVWEDTRDANYEVYYKRSTDAGVSWGADTRLTADTAVSYLPTVAVSGTTVHVAWEDARDGNSEIYYKRELTGNFVGMTNTNSNIPSSFSLGQNYPNPFNPSTTINFSIVKQENVRLTVMNELGQEIATIVDKQYGPGIYEVKWDASNKSSGVYFYKITTPSFSETKKMILAK